MFLVDSNILLLSLSVGHFSVAIHIDGSQAIIGDPPALQDQSIDDKVASWPSAGKLATFQRDSYQTLRFRQCELCLVWLLLSLCCN